MLLVVAEAEVAVLHPFHSGFTLKARRVGKEANGRADRVQRENHQKNRPDYQ